MLSLTIFLIYLFLVIILPKGIGFVGIKGIGFNLWMILSFFLLVPVLSREIVVQSRSGKLEFEKFDMILVIFILFESAFKYFHNDFKGFITEILKGYLSILPPYLAARYFLKSERDFFRCLRVLNLASIVVSCMALIEAKIGDPFFVNFSGLMLDPTDIWNNSQMSFERFGVVRTAASFSQPIFLGIFLLLIPLLNGLWIYYRKTTLTRIDILLMAAQLILAMPALIFSQSRTAMMSLIVSALFFVLFNFKNLRLSIVATLTLSAGMAMTYLLYMYGDVVYQLFFYNVLSPGAEYNWTLRLTFMAEAVDYIFSYSNLYGEGVWTSPELNLFMMKNDLLNGFINKTLVNGMLCGLLYVYIWLTLINKSYVLTKHNLLGTVMFYSFIYLFVANFITIVSFQNEIIFYVFAGISITQVSYLNTDSCQEKV